MGRSGRRRMHHLSVIEPETAAFGLLLWHFQPFPAPDPVDTLDTHTPALIDQNLTDAPIAIAAVGLASRTMASVNEALSSRNLGGRRCVARGRPRIEHARGSKTGRCERTWATHARFWEGLSINGLVRPVLPVENEASQKGGLLSCATNLAELSLTVSTSARTRFMSLEPRHPGRSFRKPISGARPCWRSLSRPNPLLSA